MHRSALSLLLIASMLYSEDTAGQVAPLPGPVMEILKDYQSEKVAAATKVIKKLKDYQVKVTKSGDLETANKIQAAIKEIEDGTPKLTVALRCDIKSLAGSWKFSLPVSKGILIFDKSGSVRHPAGIGGQYKQNADSQSGVISWGNGTAWTVSVKDDAYLIVAPDGESALQKDEQRNGKQGIDCGKFLKFKLSGRSRN